VISGAFPTEAFIEVIDKLLGKSKE